MSLYSETHGSGSDVVLLHGWGLHSDIWQSVTEGLAMEYRVTTIDLPGHGRSSNDLDRYTIDEVAAEVADTAPKEAFWLGWSLGGMVATQIALDFPTKVERLALAATSPKFIRSEDWPHAQQVEVMERFAQDLEGDYRATLMRFLALEARGSDKAREELRTLRERVFAHGEPDLAGLRGGLDILRYADLRNTVQSLSCPTLYIFGERDGLVPQAVAADVATLHPNAQQAIIPGAGHAPFISHPTLFMQAVRRFFYA